MDDRFDLKEMADQIQLLRAAAEKLNRMGKISRLWKKIRSGFWPVSRCWN